jgi:predicted nucleotidyltransferase
MRRRARLHWLAGGRAVSWSRFSPVNLLRKLVAHGVDFVVVGGIAMVYQGSARLTQDLDICFAPAQPNLDVLGAALVELGAALRGVAEDVPFVPDGRTLRQMSIVTLDTSEGSIDLLREPSGAPPYDELRRRADRVNTDGMAVLVASLDDLEAMKRAANRPKDRLDLEEIAVIRRLRAQGIGPTKG